MEQTVENNVLIAQFMGLKPTDRESYNSEEYTNVSEDLQYHKSWDWLMPVVQKCLEGEAEQDPGISNTTIKAIYEALCNTDIKEVHYSVVKFIRQKV